METNKRTQQVIGRKRLEKIPSPLPLEEQWKKDAKATI